MTVKARKQALRRAVIAQIAALDRDDRRDQEARLVARLPAVPGFAAARVVLMHVTAFTDEVNTRPMLELARESGKHLVCPRVNPERNALELFEVADLDRDLIPGWRSIPEPAAHCRLVPPLEVDWALVPGLAFDRPGYRLGRGRGHYDRLLPTLRADAGAWSLILTPQWVDDLPREPHDRPLSGVVDHGSVAVGQRLPSVSES